MSVNPMGGMSGMDINSMVSKVVDAERVPKQQRIDTERSKVETNISAYGRLRESLDSMKALMAQFRQDKAFAVRSVESSDEEVVSATATTDAIAGKYAVDVVQLAQNHKLGSNIVDEKTRFGTGELQIRLGNREFTVEVKQNAKLIDVVKSINAATGNPGVRAAIINDVDGQRLILASEKTGKDNQIYVSANSSDPINPLESLEYKTLEDRMTDLEQAQAALLKLQSTPILTADGQDVAALERKYSPQEIEEALEGKPKNPDGALPVYVVNLPGIEEPVIIDGVEQAPPKPEDTIPGFSEAASGTLLSSYDPGTDGLDDKAREKAPDIPGWSPTASGTLTDSYVTVKERDAMLMENAKAQREQELKDAQARIDAAQRAFNGYSGMNELQKGQDSMVVLDGIAQLSSDNNVIENAIDGVDLTLKGVSDSKKQTEIGIDYDRERVRNDILQFVDSYNQFYGLTKELAGADPSSGVSGPLSGDSIVRSAESRLKSVFTTAIKGAPEDLKTLTEFGITTTRQGTLEVNYDMLDRQLNKNFTKLGEFFGGNDGFAKKVEDAIHSMTGVTGSIRSREKSLYEQNYRLNDQQVQLDRRMDSLEKRTHDKFSAMQEATSKMQAQLSGMMNAFG
ncbi:Polar flagellar hook-associated protein 2 [Vibrio nigripulchritudo MADA3029]|uniref:Flagellar hook-associated protein 2 n=2 Tax=Vibrio nigripulchritudo TaxID=28173 RepID=U4K2W7_9VIBR|nr:MULTISPECIES: flagellar filament capping protein FliD [Vibrio]EGU54287.1 flagellar capping protein [Vibrio nigripulchritudo ATCC 27043]KJY80214.1 flagellar capping protein [Vibrio nigripulchritudo]UAB71243.1 flagellar filament capping protein FliD [Vibrio sp. SCSIO 43132]CCN33020.1 Polar flagellar hook-associated protein 2 [Vibrio nigripulchritudo AM115]CCN41351.1 Polar flagellar hook-associated protein 2 [Vibrio nigripulchritudo FTn2]